MGIRDRLSYYKAILAKDMAKQAELDYENFKTTRHVLHTYVGDVAGKVILDVGCGRLCSQTLLFHSLGSKVTGIDTTYVVINKPSYLKYWKSLIKNGLEGFGRDAVYAVLGKNKTYYQHLRGLSGLELEPRGLDIRLMDVEKMLFPDNVFDIVISNVAFEHIANVPRAISEVHRVLKRRGITYIRIHLFSSLSGGHHPDWNNLSRVPPWDHLRDNRHPVPVYLNRLRQHEYISLFRERFEILDTIDGRYFGKDLLTPTIRAELLDYSEEELLKKHITIVGRK